MKKYSINIISFVLAAMMAIAMFVPVFANGEISVYLDNEKIQFDVAPLLVNGRTMVPMRAIFEKLGAVVYWDNDTKTAIAQKGNVTVSIAIDQTTLYKNGEAIILDVPAQLIAGRTLVPLRAVSEAFECAVFWEEAAQTVRILSSESFIEPPKNIRIVKQENGSAYIQWDEVAGADYYHFYYQKDGDPSFWHDEDKETGEKMKMFYSPYLYTVEYWGLENGNKYNIIITSVKNGVESRDSEIFTFTYDAPRKEEAFNKLINWVNENSNSSSPAGNKEYVYKVGNGVEIAIIPYIGVSGANLLTINYGVSDRNEHIGVDVKLIDSVLQFGGNYMGKVGKTYNYAEGYIVKSGVSNSLDLACDWYTGDYLGDKNTLLERYRDSINITLKLFDGFLKTNSVGLTLEDFGMDFDISSVVLPKGLTQQEVTFEFIRDSLLDYQESEGRDKAELAKSFDDANGSQKYSILYDDKKDIIRLSQTRIYKGSRTYSSIELTPDKQSYQCMFSFYYPENKSNTPDFEATYIIDAKTFGENSNITFEIVKGSKANANLYKETAKLMVLNSLDDTNTLYSMTDFGFNLK